MNKKDCRVGMVVFSRWKKIKAVVVKCNPRRASVRVLEEIEGRSGGDPGSLWSIPYGLLDPVVDASLKTEMAMRSFADTDNEGIKTYFKEVSKAEQPVDFPEGSPEWYVMKAICELWRRLDDDNLDREASGRHSKAMELRAHYSGMINSLFSVLGREISQYAATTWETGNKSEAEVSTS